MIFLSEFEYGKTQNIEVKVGRKTLMIDVDKNKISACIDVYEKLSNDRKSYSKYDSEIHCVHVNPNAIIDREFIENVPKIESALKILDKFKYILDR